MGLGVGIGERTHSILCYRTVSTRRMGLDLRMRALPRRLPTIPTITHSVSINMTGKKQTIKHM